MDIDLEAIEAGLVVVEKFLTKRRINLEAVVHALNPIWKMTKNSEVEDDGITQHFLCLEMRKTWIESCGQALGLSISIC